MTLKKVAAIYSFLTGISMFVVWGIYFAAGKVMGVEPEPLGLSFHIAAELMTGATMIVAGLGLFGGRPWAPGAYFMGLGMMIYAVVNAPGLYIGKGWFIMAVFASSFVCAAIFSAIGFAMDGGDRKRG